ncbi:MAG: lysine transporter, partial [Gammaproteobacteria bacterium]|nr:lysine transporter [Gammaproteobacteria bacterium]
MISAFLYGLVLAFGLILPLGPQNMFILNQGARARSWHHPL